MNVRRLRACTALVALSALGAPLAAQEAKKAEAPKTEAKKGGPAPAGMPSPEEMMKKWQAYATPGDAHKKLEAMAGTWTAKVKAWMDPGKPPEESEGTMEDKMVLGGRYLEHRYEGTMMGGPFSGIGYTGYDNGIKKYQGYWIDSAGTGMMITTGSFDKTGKVMTMTGTMDDFITGKKSKVKEVFTSTDPDHNTMEMWNQGPDGKMMKSLQIEYSRKK